MTHMNIFEQLSLFASVVIASVLVGVIKAVITDIPVRERRVFWLILVGSMVLNALRLMARSVKLLNPEEDLMIDSVFQLLIEAYLLYYLHKIYSVPKNKKQEKNNKP